VFVGVVAGALIQHFLNTLQTRRQAKNALAVMQIEIAYNRSEVESFRERLTWLKSRIASKQIADDDLFLPMQKFDYSSIGPLTNAGFFHVLLGPEKVRAYLEFYNFFRVENGAQLTAMLKTEHEAGKSMAFLEWVERRTDEVLSALEPIQYAKLSSFGYRLKLPKR
jgi:hypothetical protein